SVVPASPTAGSSTSRPSSGAVGKKTSPKPPASTTPATGTPALAPRAPQAATKLPGQALAPLKPTPKLKPKPPGLARGHEHAPRLSAGARSPSAADAHLDSGRDLPDRCCLVRDRPGRGPQRHPLHRLRSASDRADRPGAVLAPPRPAAGAGRRGCLVAAPAGG